MRRLGRSCDDNVWAAAKFAVFARQCLLSPQIARGSLFMYFDRAHLQVSLLMALPVSGLTYLGATRIARTLTRTEWTFLQRAEP